MKVIDFEKIHLSNEMKNSLYNEIVIMWYIDHKRILKLHEHFYRP